MRSVAHRRKHAHRNDAVSGYDDDKSWFSEEQLNALTRRAQDSGFVRVLCALSLAHQGHHTDVSDKCAAVTASLHGNDYYPVRQRDEPLSAVEQRVDDLLDRHALKRFPHCQVPRVSLSELSSSAFAEQYVRRNRPVIVEAHDDELMQNLRGMLSARFVDHHAEPHVVVMSCYQRSGILCS